MSAEALGRRRPLGFTLIELMVVVALVAIMLSLAAPSFTNFFAKKRVESVGAELGTDLQYARSESVARNANVRVTLGTGCYVIHLASATAASCTQTTKTVTPTDAEIKTVQLQSGSTATFSPTSGYVEFEPVRGSVGDSSGLGSPATIGVTSTTGSWQLNLCIATIGRVATYTSSGAGAIAGYTTSCPTS